jgi:tetratricopeptide (TPR) repeat protein
MNPAILRRYIVLMILAIAAAAAFSLGYDFFTAAAPGDYYVRKGDIRLGEGKFDEALENFDLALAEAPDHRGAVMGRAVVFTQTERYNEAIAEYEHLIRFLEDTLEADDRTGLGTLAAAYANRGIVYDRLGNYQAALDSYIEALRTDAGAVSGPDVVHKILYGSEDVSSVRKRAQYIYEQLQLPEDQRLLRIPEIDDKQRMFKP